MTKKQQLISFVSRTEPQWAGDLKVLYDLQEGLLDLGHVAKVISCPSQAGEKELVFLSNTCRDLRDLANFLHLARKPYGIVSFHEDFIRHQPASFGFFFCVYAALKELVSEEGFAFSLERLLENPQMVYYYGMVSKKITLVNYDVLKQAKVCIVTSPTEKKTLKRDCPLAHADVMFLSPGFAADFEQNSSDDFLKFTGLCTGEYILQVGRMEFRKNQLASILSTRNLKMPLVFVATTGFHDLYREACIEAILKWRKDVPTWLIAQDLESQTIGNLHIVQMPDKEKLSKKMLQSAFAHAGLHLHPAFYELPGATNLEASYLGIPTVGCSWGSIRDYCQGLDDRIEYCEPYDLVKMEKLVKKKFGQKFSKKPNIPVFSRTKKDMALDFLHITEKFFHV